MPLNNLYDEQAVIQAIASALETFYGTLIEKIDGLNIQKVMRRKNPYLYRAKAMQSANEIVDSVLTAFVSSSEETIFGNCFFEPIAIAASGGNKALAEGIDIMIQNTDPNTGKTITHIVDGQQRINAIFEYIAGKYKLQKKHLIDEEIKKKYADRYFYELDDDTKKAIWSYEMSIVNLDKHFSKDEVRNMFYRLNLTDYSLNEQEKRKSWDSEFGKVSEQLANEIFWQDYKIFSTADVRRMRDVEYCSSILLLAREGILDQTKGDRLDQIYRELGEEYVDSKEDIEKVHNAMELIKIITEDKTNGFVNKKIQMYTLFCVMFDFSEKKISISQDMVEKLKIFIQCYTLFKNEYEIESESTEEQRTIEYLKKYKLASSEGVNKIGNRMIRFEVLKKVLLQTDGIETDIFEKTARKMEKMNSSEEETDG